MLKLLYYVLLFSCSSFADIEELGDLEELFHHKSDHNVRVVQKRWLDRKFLSELSVSLSPSLRGFYYMNNYSTNVSYRFFLNEKLSVHAEYTYFFNLINEEGENEIALFGRVPVDLKHAPRQSYAFGFDWYPFYAKSVFFNRVLHFDFYLSMGLGQIKLLKVKERPLLFSSALGMVHWWSKRWNTRVEIEGFHYRHLIPQSQSITQEWNYRMSLSAGVLF